MTEIPNLWEILESTGIGIGTGIIAAAIAHWFLKFSHGITGLLSVGVALIVGVLVFSVVPPVPVPVPPPPELIEVPDLGNMSFAEAEQSLSNKGIIPQSRPQLDSHTKKGYVIPQSQTPLPGTMVRKGTVISFAVSTNEVKIKIFKPGNAEAVDLTRMNNGAYHFSVQGVSSGLSQEEQLLLWVRPSNVLHWYLQRSPDGIREIRPDGSWDGFGQIGNVNWPPKSGDTFDVAITVVDSQTARELLSASGEAIQQALPGTSFDKVTGVKVNKLH